MTSPDKAYRQWLDTWCRREHGEVITWSRLEDGTRTIEVALDADAELPALGAKVEVRRV